MNTNPISLIITSDATISAQLEAMGLTVKILVINSVTGNPYPMLKFMLRVGRQHFKQPILLVLYTGKDLKQKM